MTSDNSERKVFCSGCYGVLSESHIHVIPFFNEDLDNYVTTFRCDDCWLSGLEDTEKRLQSTEDAGEITKAAMFFERHAIIIPEFRRGDPPEAVKQILLRVIGLLRSGGLTLVIGETMPFDINDSSG